MAPTLIRVDPTELVFDVREGRLDEIRLNVQNVTQQRLGYKLFTDQGGLYLFQPKSGFIDKASTVEVAVKLQKVPKDTTAVNHTTVIKARVARDDELDREKEWRTALPQDDSTFHIIPLKTRFVTKSPGVQIVKVATVDEDLLAILRRIEMKCETGFSSAVKMARANALLLAVVFVLAGIGMFD